MMNTDPVINVYLYLYFYIQYTTIKKNLGGGKILKEVFDLITNTVKNLVLWNEYI